MSGLLYVLITWYRTSSLSNNERPVPSFRTWDSIAKNVGHRGGCLWKWPMAVNGLILIVTLMNSRIPPRRTYLPDRWVIHQSLRVVLKLSYCACEMKLSSVNLWCWVIAFLNCQAFVSILVATVTVAQTLIVTSKLKKAHQLISGWRFHGRFTSNNFTMSAPSGHSKFQCLLETANSKIASMPLLISNNFVLAKIKS